jgi:hypothetical protein
VQQFRIHSTSFAGHATPSEAAGGAILGNLSILHIHSHLANRGIGRVRAVNEDDAEDARAGFRCPAASVYLPSCSIKLFNHFARITHVARATRQDQLFKLLKPLL